jgi:hypothetical protein
MPGQPATLSELEHARAALYAELAGLGDFRRGSLNAVRRKCGKRSCACAQPDHPGHGPQHNFTRSVAGRTVNVHPATRAGAGEAAPGGGQLPALRGTERAHRGGQRGDLRGETGVAARRRDRGTAGGGKRGLFRELQAEFAAELARLAELAASLLGGGEGLAALELAIRTAMTRLGGSFLEQLLAGDAGHRGQRVECGAGHHATFAGYRPRTLDTVLGPITLRRAYYHCRECAHGVVPRDETLGVAGASLSPGLRAMVARAGTAAPFARARELLAELAGVMLTTKRVERSAEADGATVAAATAAEAAAVLAGEVVPLAPDGPPAKLYVAIDGTGVPTVPADTAGRAGKAADGRARTREVKLGVLFTQTRLDAQGRPERDAGSSSYVASFEPAAHFATLLYAEALRRGAEEARELVVLGDGAPWIWNVAAEHFPAATIAVGTALAGGPPHRSQRAELPHWAPASGANVEAHLGIGVQDASRG